LKIDSWFLYSIVSLVLFVAQSFLEVFCKNHFRTIPSLIQFKFAPVSNKAIISILKSYEKINVIFIIYFFEIIWVKTCRKSSRACSMFDNAWFYKVWSVSSSESC
jgi:hypothetical protein